MTTKSFTVDVAKWAEKVGAQLEQVALKVAFDLHARVVLKTPVGNPDLWAANAGKSRGDPGFAGKGYVGGTLRQNWQITAGAPATGIIERAAGLFPEKVFSSVLSSFRAGDTIFIRNNLPYARRVEAGWSKQAPSGMLALTVLEFEQAMRQAIGETFR